MSTRKSTAVYPSVLEAFETRKYLAAHIVGSTVNYATIQAAVDAATPSAIITVDAGTYNEQVFLTKSLTIKGAKAGVDARSRATTGETIMGGITANGAQTGSFFVTADNVTIDGFTVQGVTNKSTTRGAGIVIYPNISGTKVVNNIIQNNVAGLFLANASSTNPAIIRNNLFKNNNNAGVNGGRGIYTDGEIAGDLLTNVIIDANTFTGNRGGSGTTTLEAAVAIERQSAGKQSNITITNNTFTNNGKSVLFINTTGVLIQGNSASGALDWYSGSLRFEGNNHDVTISYNNIFNNTGPGVAVDANGTPGDNSGFVVTNNNIYGNGTTSGGKLGVIFNQSVYDGTFIATNNYWGAASGPSGDGPGTGDSVYGNASKATQWSYAKGGTELFSPWATATIDISKIAAPTAPTSLAAKAISSSQIALTWTVTSTTATSQTVQRSTDGVNFINLATVSGAATTFTDSGLSTGTTYYYRVTASNTAGTSSPSNVASTKTQPYQAPVAPRNLVVSSVTTSSVALSWSLPSYTVGIANYIVYRNGTAVGTATGTSYTDSGLSANTAYTYTVATVDTTGAISAASTAVVGVTAAAPAWNTVSLSAYYNRIGIVVDGRTFSGGGFDKNGNALSSTALGLKATVNGSTYTFGAAGVNDIVNAAGQTIALPQSSTSSIGLIMAAINGNQANQSFIVRYTDGTSQTITRSISDWATPQNYAGETTAVAMSYRDTSLGAKQTIAIKVYAYVLAVNSAKTVSGITLPNNGNLNVLAVNVAGVAPSLPVAPQGLAAAALSSNQIRISWTPVGSPSTYLLQRSADGVNFVTVSSTISGTASNYTDSGLAAGTTYSYRLYAVNSVGTSPASAIASATTASSTVITTQLSSIPWVSATAGYGTTQLNASIVGNPITLRGTTYSSGLGTHAASTIVYNLAGKYTRFLSDLGVDDEVNGKGTGSVNFQIIGDGKVLFDSGVVTNLNGIVSADVDLTGVKTLTLVANSVGGNIDFAHADWANARLLSTAQLPAAPINVTAAGLTTTSIQLRWAAGNGSAATGYKIERSLNGTTWAALTTVAATVLSYSDTGLTNGTTYFYRVRATNSVGDSAYSATVSAKPIAITAVTTQLSSLNWTSATTGYGSVQKNLNASGDPLNIGGVTYASGIGTHADSTIVYNLAGAYSTFQSDIGYDYRTAGKPSDPVYFQVIADGRVIYDSGTMTNTDPAKSISVDVTGVTTLTLVVKAVVPGNIDYCHVDWAGAQLISNA